MSNEQPQDPDELAKMQEENDKKEEKTLDEVDKSDERLSPGDRVEWNDEQAFKGTKWEDGFVFVVPSAKDYREQIPTEEIGASQSGDIKFDPTIIDDMMKDYVIPAPNMEEMSPAQFKAVETAFYNFVQSFRRSDVEGAS